MLHRALTDLASSTHDIQLAGLPSDDVAQLVSEYTGREPTAELVATLVDRTGGNPFFVRELLRFHRRVVTSGTDLADSRRSTSRTTGRSSVPVAVGLLAVAWAIRLPPVDVGEGSLNLGWR